MSVLRAVSKRKKVRKLGAIDIIRREAYADLELDAKVELIRALVSSWACCTCRSCSNRK